MKHHIKPLTSIRAIGVFWVIIGHYHAMIYTVDYDPFRHIMRYPMLAVDTFFFLSGFVLSYIYSRKLGSFAVMKTNWRSFILSRIARIYPLHLATLFLSIAMVYAGIYAPSSPLVTKDLVYDNNLQTAFYHLFLIHGTGITKGVSWNYPSWSISVEFMLYLLFPLLILLLSRLKFWLWNLLIIAVVCVYYYMTIVDIAITFDNQAISNRNLLFFPALWQNDILRGLANFTIGLCLYNLYATKFLRRLAWDWVLLLICVAMLTMMLTRTPMNIVILIMPLFIYALANLKSFMQVIFCNKILVYLGEISYGLYMLHIPYAIFVLHVFYDNDVGGMEFWGWRFIPMLGGLIALSALSYHYFETPIRRFVKRKARTA